MDHPHTDGEKTTKNTIMHVLPSELLLRIFSHLDYASALAMYRVNRCFQAHSCVERSNWPEDQVIRFDYLYQRHFYWRISPVACSECREEHRFAGPVAAAQPWWVKVGWRKLRRTVRGEQSNTLDVANGLSGVL
ncbi:hypothetical protein B0T24DRAFT_588081 [Lasiosphaeria ovina]|uniref:F-box domain-containing protein n=1 Tax=Lasiosphaeria ovina TaxID=92902 RepID=A0AAE0TXT3_9PEZI|nr:hypothetical protein B0T24DRAFT_588081 [Lasiosphaeria ovina]